MKARPIDEDETDHLIFRFETIFSKHADAGEILDFSVMLNGYDDYGELPKVTVARLRGFLAQPGHLPHMGSGGWYFDIFDMRSQHAMLAYHVLTDDAPHLAKALESDAYLDDLESLAMLERMWVHPQLRGRRIGLRLLREAQHVLSRHGLLVILKAHPDGGSRKGGSRNLTDYYLSDDRLGLREVHPEKHPGWLVAAWEECHPPEDDESYFMGDVGSLEREDDPND